MTATVAAAVASADAAIAGAAPPRHLVIPQRVVAIGDPQASAARFFEALDAADLLGGDGWLRPDVRVVALGDYFDYRAETLAESRQAGVRILAWLAAHAPAQVTILLGNHDTARVMELASLDDARFALAHERARALGALAGEARVAATAAFTREFPEIATPGYAARDFNAFTVEQRALVMRLLLARRCALASVERALDGTRVLVTHAGVTLRQLAQLGIARERQPRPIARALNARLEAAVAAVEDDWRAGRCTPLDLTPLHVAAARGREGGGLLYHRPADPQRADADRAWENDAVAPRRFDPRDLPPGLVQVIGHTGHLKAYEEMPAWRDPGMPAPTKTAHRGGLRTLAATARGEVTYRRGIQPPAASSDAVVWMIDPEMSYVATASDVALLELAPSDG